MNICDICNEAFQGKARQVTCSKTCHEKKKIQKLNSKWVSRKPRKVDPRLNSWIENSRVYSKSVGYLKKFNACRG